MQVFTFDTERLMNILAVKCFLIVTLFQSVSALRTFTRNPQQAVKPIPCYHHVPIPRKAGGLQHQPGQPLSNNNVCLIELFPKGFLVLAASILGFLLFPRLAVADAVASSHPTLTVDQTDLSPTVNRRNVHQWTFANGDVVLPDEIYIASMTLKHPRLLGSGAGGAVFALQQKSLYPSSLDGGHLPEVALKVSWKGSSQDVKKECDILKKLQQSPSKHEGHIDGVEVCLGEGLYIPDPTRTIIALQPVFHDELVASVEELLPDQRKVHTAVELIMRTMLQMISAHVVTIDVQPLISRETGEVLFIDFTQAISTSEGHDIIATADMEAVVMRNFVNEMMLLIPKEQQESIASKLLIEELSSYPKLSRIVYNVLMEQSFSNEALEYLARQSMP